MTFDSNTNPRAMDIHMTLRRSIAEGPSDSIDIDAAVNAVLNLTPPVTVQDILDAQQFDIERMGQPAEALPEKSRGSYIERSAPERRLYMDLYQALLASHEGTPPLA